MDAIKTGLIPRVKNILLTPKTEWPVIDVEPTTKANIYMGYVAPLALIGVIATLIGTTVFGVSLGPLGRARTPILSAIVTAILQFGLTFLSVFLIAWIVDMLAPTFGGQRDPLRALKVTAYSFTPGWVAAVLGIFPPLALIGGLIGLYGLYLLYLGLPVLMRSPKDKALGYTIVTVIIAIVVWLVIGFLTTCVAGLGMLGAGALRSSAPAMTKQQSADAGADAAAGILSKMMGGKTDADRERMKGALSQLQQMGEQAQNAEKAAKAQGKDPSAAAANSVDMGAAMGAVSTMMAGGKDVTPVNFRALKDLLPESLPGGMRRTEASAESQEAMGMKGSTARAHYTDGTSASIDLEIVDLGSMSGLAALATNIDPKVERETETGYERTRKVDGGLVHEKYDRQSKSGEFAMLIDNRFTVTAHGYSVDEATIANALRTIDTKKFAQLAAAANSAQAAK
jgi:hypothetical protein